MSNRSKNEALRTIRENISKRGYHIYTVVGGAPVPRYTYSIGLTESDGIELVLAGANFYSGEEAVEIVTAIAEDLRARPNWRASTYSFINHLGSFRLERVHESWTRELLLGATDYFKDKPEINALQIVPDKDHHTIDVPQLDRPWSASDEPIWQWLREPWPFKISPAATVATNIAALRGGEITEVARWEDDYWELFAGAGPDVAPEDGRAVTIAIFLGSDPTLKPIVELDVGAALWRDSRDDEWHIWKSSGD